ncbi:hypothetical protein [Stenotrophomonas sp. CC120223-11]|uniref:hypothetical protein n=1 Tax=Stenotrophomonas sp. CC120223-11 TaxID=1378090 RepID=UPI000BD313D0|nr:hypothetical protein [Stenotrophomonas sp. CC120223-11]SNY75876.1 hypothetical protein SAMN02744784_03843 [Stenotrophomonas sp. CC120223-11]
MRPYTLAALLSTLPCAVHALDLPPVQYPALPARAATAAGFVPNGWTLESSIEGDLDQVAAPIWSWYCASRTRATSSNMMASAPRRMTATRAFSPWHGRAQPAICWRCRTIS